MGSSMEEFGLLKERFQAITEKHHIQEHIRLKKLELDQDKLKLQHLKKKVLREQWLLQDSASHNARDSQKQQSPLSDQQQIRALQLNIHRIEMEILSLEQEESMVSNNESLILNRLKAVEKSPKEIIKEAQVNFVSEPLQILTLVPQSLSPSASIHTPVTLQSVTPRKTLFAKNLQTGESTVLSTAAVPPEVYDDGQKRVYALNSQGGSHDLSCISELSANEVEQLLRCATVHHQVNHSQHPSREGHYLYSHKDEGSDLHNQGEQYGNCVLTNSVTEKNVSCREPWHGHQYGHQGNHYSKKEERNNHNNVREGHQNHKWEGHHYGNQIDGHYSSYLVRNCPSFQQDSSASRHINGFIRSNRVSGGRTNGCSSPSPHHQEVARGYEPQLSGYVTDDKEDHYCYSQPCYHSYSQTENSHNQSTTRYSGPTTLDRLPSPLYGDDTLYTILNTLDTTEPITAIFMGFQAAQDDSGQSQEFVDSLKAELVIIEDNEQYGEGINTKKESHAQLGISGNLGCVEEFRDRRTEKQIYMSSEGGESVHLTRITFQ